MLSSNRAGTRVGMPLADFCFNLAFRPCQKEITDRLSAAGMTLHAHDPGLHSAPHVFTTADELPDSPQQYEGLAFIDDLLTMVEFEGHLWQTTMIILVQTVHHALTSRGFLPNYARGKT